jgi:hypothetical protein
MERLGSREQEFIGELADLMRRYGVTIEQRVFYDSAHYSESWSIEGKDFELDISDVAEWLSEEGGGSPTMPE